MVAAPGRNLFLWIEPGEISNHEQGMLNEEVIATETRRHKEGNYHIHHQIG